jgi:integral membrane protein
MQQFFTNSIFRLRWIAILEGISYLLLLGLAMPLKYIAKIPEPVQVIGLAHGLLFVAYILLVLQVHFEHSWKIKQTLIFMVASLLPIAPFYVEKKYLRNEEL